MVRGADLENWEEEQESKGFGLNLHVYKLEVPYSLSGERPDGNGGARLALDLGMESYLELVC